MALVDQRLRRGPVHRPRATVAAGGAKAEAESGSAWVAILDANRIRLAFWFSSAHRAAILDEGPGVR